MESNNEFEHNYSSHHASEGKNMHRRHDDEHYIAALMDIHIDTDPNEHQIDCSTQDLLTEYAEPTEFPFLELPPEVRYLVYRQIMHPTQKSKCRTGRHRCSEWHLKGPYSPQPLKSLMLTCRALFAEISHALLTFTDIPILAPEDFITFDPERNANDSKESQPGKSPLGAPLHYIHPMLRSAPIVTGRWARRWWTEPLQPTIPLRVLRDGKSYHRRKVEMLLNLRMCRDTSGLNPSFTVHHRLRKHLLEARDSSESLSEFVRFERNGPLRVCVLFKVVDRAVGKHMCTVLMEGGVATVVRRYKCGLSDDAIQSIFYDVFTPDVVEKEFSVTTES